MGDDARKTAAKWFKVYRTVCEMAKDRGYSEEAEQELNTIKTKDQENIWMQNTQSSIQSGASQNLIIPPFFHDSNQEDICKMLNMQQHLYVFHSTSAVKDQALQSYDATIHKQHEDDIRNNPDLQIFVNVIILVPEEKDIIPKRTQDIILISNKMYKDRIELYEKRWTELAFNSTKKPTQIPRESKIYYKYEIFYFEDLVINITKHQLVPKHVPLNCVEKKVLMEKYNINDAQLPKILATDPITKYFGLRAKQVFKIERDSETAGKYITYRIVS